ncbi:hypothetical protein JK386_17935 [Nocardioides sp. zg-536]|uniref:Uncharacterized protein n=1 Tax=Nocardioides faecalis TaxID=2803858 RepID=A0A938Y4K7_9ACTN|nr:hypothetical protein [Nocardioides faecalis]MBM9461776.1 hypothetical protein [Nocardioides faecalis]QVI57822.1 hypothetical protein KG111_12215 [Nocardioides faecalis]
MSVLVGVVIIWFCRGRERAGLAAPVLAMGSCVAAAWVVVTVAVGPGSGGDVVWVLPEWAPASGGRVGGPVTTGRLWTGVELALRALAHLALLACVARCVSGERLAGLADVAFGRLAPVVHPWCFLADELARAERRRAPLRAHSLGRVASGGVLPAAADRAASWRALGASTPSGRPAERVRALVVLVGAGLALAASVAAGVGGVEASLLLAVAVLTTGFLLSLPRAERPDPGEVVVLVCAALNLVVAMVDLDPYLRALPLLLLPAATLATWKPFPGGAVR